MAFIKFSFLTVPGYHFSFALLLWVGVLAASSFACSELWGACVFEFWFLPGKIPRSGVAGS